MLVTRDVDNQVGVRRVVSVLKGVLKGGFGPVRGVLEDAVKVGWGHHDGPKPLTKIFTHFH